MFAAVLVALLAFVPSAIPQSATYGGNTSNNDYYFSFELDSLTTGILALFCIFTFLFFILTVWCLVALILSRGHRAPYAFLLPALILTTFGNGANIALETYLNWPSGFYVPSQLIPALTAIQLFFANWAILLLFLSLIAVLWNRETALHVATDDESGGRNRLFIVAYAILTSILFVLGLAGPIVYVVASQKYNNAINQIDAAATDYPVVSIGPDQLQIWLSQQRKIWRSIEYGFDSIVVLTGVVVIISTILLWKAGRAAGIRDKITNTMLYAICPLYAAYNLSTIAFAIALSDRFLPPASRSQTTYEAVTLANNLVLLLSHFAVAFTLVFMSVNKKNWNIMVQPIGNIPPQQHLLTDQAQPIGQPADHHQPLSMAGPEAQVHTQQQVTQIPI